MPLDIPLQESHRGYIRAVAGALTQAGISVVGDIDFFDDIWNDAEPIRAAQFQISDAHTEQVYGIPAVWLRWTEEWGWIMPFAPTLCDQVLPKPTEVVAAVQAGLAKLPAQRKPRPTYRSYTDYDDVLEAELEAYTAKNAAPRLGAPLRGEGPSR
jgi:hypothetical protein